MVSTSQINGFTLFIHIHFGFYILQIYYFESEKKTDSQHEKYLESVATFIAFLRPHQSNGENSTKIRIATFIIFLRPH